MRGEEGAEVFHLIWHTVRRRHENKREREKENVQPTKHFHVWTKFIWWDKVGRFSKRK